MITAAISIGTIWSKAWPILLAILFFGFLIFFHELGHFTFAKIFKVKVNEFSIGMGPLLLKRKKKETQYSLRLLPIGGYVAMEGENEASEDERAFCNQKAWKRFLILAAGGTINIIMGIILIAVMLSVSDLVSTNRIHSFSEDAISPQSGLQVDDRLVKINNKRVFSGDDITFLMQRDRDGVFDFVVERDGEYIELHDVKFRTEMMEYAGKERLTIVYDFYIIGEEPNFKNVITNVIPETLTYSRLVYLSLFDLVTGTYGLTDLSGPIGTVSFVAEAAGEAAKSLNWSYVFMLMALIAINIGLFNLLPLPALDGGHLLFLLIEMIFRKPVPRKLEGLVHAIGMILLLALMAVISFSDIWKLIKG